MTFGRGHQGKEALIKEIMENLYRPKLSVCSVLQNSNIIMPCSFSLKHQQIKISRHKNLCPQDDDWDQDF